MKILFLIDALHKGGKERRMIELFKGLIKKGDVHMELVLFANVIDYPEIHKMGIPIHILERKPKKDPRVFYRVYQVCKSFQPDIIHAWSSMSAFFALPAKWILNVKLVNGNIADAPKNLKLWKKQLFRAKLTFPFSDVIIANSKAGLKSYKAPKSKSICIYNGFDFKRVENLKPSRSIREKYRISIPYVIGMVAAFTDRKDYYSYLEAAKLVLDKRDDVVFMAIGGGPNLEYCKQLIPEQLKDKIIFTGPLSDVESIVNIFDVGVLSTNSDIHGEGISNSIMEYMVFSKPVVATEGGGTDEIVMNDNTGFRVPAKSPGIMAEKILFLLANPDIASEMGVQGRKRVYEEFNLDKMTEVYYKLYKNLSKGNHSFSALVR